jgi:16S rRNA (guanine1516-N2)-methyltransferase
MTTGSGSAVVFVGTAETPANDPDRLLCIRFGVPFVPAPASGAFRLERGDAGQLVLRAPAAAGGLALDADAFQAQLRRRLATARREQPIGRAFGLHRRGDALRVVDATAGLGRDSLLLAHLGCRVLAFERLPALALWIADLVARSGVADALAAGVGAGAGAVEVHAADGATALRELTPPWAPPDAVYLDPMFAAAGRSQVKKEMQLCRLLAGPPRDVAVLVDAAFRAGAARVVVKRHPHEPPLRASPSHTVEGERVRFDVYLGA